VTLVPGLLAGLLFLTVRERDGIRPTQSFSQMSVTLPASFRRFLVAVGVFGAGDFSRTLLILWALGVDVKITQSDQLTLPVLLYVAYNIVGAASAYLTGAWSDRRGRRGFLLFGYALAAVVSLLMALDQRPLMVLIAVFVGSGVFIGIEEAIERASPWPVRFSLERSGSKSDLGMLSVSSRCPRRVSSALVGPYIVE